jgi:hypothetical protein
LGKTGAAGHGIRAVQRCQLLTAGACQRGGRRGGGAGGGGARGGGHSRPKPETYTGLNAHDCG